MGSERRTASLAPRGVRLRRCPPGPPPETGRDPLAGHAVDYQNLGGDAYEVVVGGHATQGTVIPVGETDWVAISHRGTMR